MALSVVVPAVPVNQGREVHAGANVLVDGNLGVDGTAEFDGAVTFNSTLTPTTGKVTFTQTYSTAGSTIAALTYAAPTAITAAALTVADGAGTNDGTIGAITDNATTIAAVQELAAQIAKLVTDLTSVRTQLVAAAADILDMKKNDNKIIDALQALGLSA